MTVLRIVIRLVRLLGLMCAGLIQGNAAHVRRLQSDPPDAAARERVQRWFRQVLACLGVNVTTHGTPEPVCLVVSNHISWLDILVLGSVAPVAFLSKDEVARWPVIGRLAAAGGTLYIARGAHGAASRAHEEIVRALARNQSIAIFPEGTTTDGRGVRKFYPILFSAATQAARPVQPVAIAYPHAEGVHPHIPFIDDDYFVFSMLRVLGSPTIRATVHFGPAIASDNIERKDLAVRAHAFVAERVAASVTPTPDP